MAPGRVAQSATCLATDASLTADPGVLRERSGSVVLGPRDRGIAGSSLTGVTALWSLSKTHLS